VLAARTDAMLKTLKHARLDHSYDAEFRKLVAVDLLILDDFAIDVLDPTESRDLYDLLLERDRTGSIVVTSSRARRMAGDLRRPDAGAGRHRPLHQQRLRPCHRRGIVSAPPQAQAPEGREGAQPMIGARPQGAARRQPQARAGVVSTAAERLQGSSMTSRTMKGWEPSRLR
jgi:hypothetical protein